MQIYGIMFYVLLLIQFCNFEVRLSDTAGGVEVSSPDMAFSMNVLCQFPLLILIHFPSVFLMWSVQGQTFRLI